MISVNNISKEFTGTILFEKISFSINPRERIGLAGRNGSGKTTLLKIICGLEPTSGGEVVFSKDDTLGYLPQEKEISADSSIMDEALKAFASVNEQQNRLNELHLELTQRNDYNSPAYHKLLDAIDLLNQSVSLAEPDKLKGNAEKVLSGLGFKNSDFDRKLTEFSQGWRMRVELAKLLLQKPSLLLLDEPTNHLDIESIQWLEEFLINYNGAVMMVSHDRVMLDKVTNRTIELNNGKAYDYRVSYSEYIQLRNERVKIQQAAFSNQQKQIQEVERFIERFRYKASKAKQVQSRVKLLDKMERVEIDELDNSFIRFSFPSAPSSGKIVAEGNSLAKKYGEKIILNNIDFEILKGEKIAFVGRNGEGKTTLARILAGKLPFEGEFRLGFNVVTGYFAQDQWEMLDPEKTVFETLDEVAVGDIRTRLKAILGSFLFSGDEIEKKVRVLSGGEKSRLAMARLLLKPSNLLILDEPTNHLDILSKDILKSALLQYNGTLVLVSHDRDFLQGLTGRLYEFSNQKIKEHLGGIEEYLEKRKLKDLSDLEKAAVPLLEKVEKAADNKLKWEKKKESEKILRKLANAVELIENEIHSLEQKLKIVNDKLSSPELFSEEIKSGLLYREHKDLNNQIAEKYQIWDSKQAELENAKKII